MFVARQEVLTLNDLQEVPVFNDPPEAQRRVVRPVVQTLGDQMEVPVRSVHPEMHQRIQVLQDQAIQAGKVEGEIDFSHLLI